MQIRARVITGSHDEVDLLLHHIDLFAREIDLVTALIVFAVALKHGEIAVRRLVVKGIVLGEVFYRVRRGKGDEKIAPCPFVCRFPIYSRWQPAHTSGLV